MISLPFLYTCRPKVLYGLCCYLFDGLLKPRQSLWTFPAPVQRYAVCRHRFRYPFSDFQNPVFSEAFPPGAVIPFFDYPISAARTKNSRKTKNQGNLIKDRLMPQVSSLLQATGRTLLVFFCRLLRYSAFHQKFHIKFSRYVFDEQSISYPVLGQRHIFDGLKVRASSLYNRNLKIAGKVR